LGRHLLDLAKILTCQNLLFLSSFPGFGFFNDDEYLDIMIGWQTGSYPLYDSLMVS